MEESIHVSSLPVLTSLRQAPPGGQARKPTCASIAHALARSPQARQEGIPDRGIGNHTAPAPCIFEQCIPHGAAPLQRRSVAHNPQRPSGPVTSRQLAVRVHRCVPHHQPSQLSGRPHAAHPGPRPQEADASAAQVTACSSRPGDGHIDAPHVLQEADGTPCGLLPRL